MSMRGQTEKPLDSFTSALKRLMTDFPSEMFSDCDWSDPWQINQAISERHDQADRACIERKRASLFCSENLP